MSNVLCCHSFGDALNFKKETDRQTDFNFKRFDKHKGKERKETNMHFKQRTRSKPNKYFKDRQIQIKLNNRHTHRTTKQAEKQKVTNQKTFR